MAVIKFQCVKKLNIFRHKKILIGMQEINTRLLKI